MWEITSQADIYMEFNRQYFEYDAYDNVWNYKGPLTSSLWRGIKVSHDEDNDAWIVLLEHPNGDIIEHFNTIEEVNEYLDRVFTNKI